MPQHHDIQLRFLRRGQPRHSSSDDILRVIKLGENSVRVIYTEVSQDGRIVDVQIMNYAQMTAYLYRIFWLLGLDDDPFESVQFFLPGYPTVLLRVESVKAHVNHLMELMVTTCWSWPAVGRAQPYPTSTVPVAESAEETG